MKMRTLTLKSKQLMDTLRGKTGEIPFNIPADAELLDVKFDLQTGELVAVVRSESFEDVADAYPIPELKSATSAAKRAPASAALTPAQKVPSFLSSAILKTEHVSGAGDKTEQTPKRPSRLASKPNASLLEEEFSEEQRRLLSFAVEGDALVVKPVKFLKAEWDDINEVVRSLGGRWVKGDIISYWEIPLSQS